MNHAVTWGMLLIVAATSYAGMAWYGRHRVRRQGHLRRLAAQRPELIRDTEIQIAAEGPERCVQEFASERLVRIENFVTPHCLAVLRKEAEAHIHEMERTFIPIHKKGATLSYEQIHALAPHCLAFYHSAEVQWWVSTMAGVTVYPTPDQDQSSLSLLCYHEAGDHINWHYDHNFYRGRHFTVLLSLVNEGRSGGLSQGTFQRRKADGERSLDTSPNVLIMFEGAKVRHRATPVGQGERRIMLSMTYCADPEISRFKEFVRRCKDTAFFGLRALWD